MARQARRRAIGMVLLVCGLPGCVLITDRWTLTDLEVRSVRVVLASKTDELRRSVYDTPPAIPVLQVEFSSPTVDLYRFARDGDYYVGETGSLCPDGKSYHASDAVSDFAYVYGAMGEVKPDMDTVPDKRLPRTYRAYIALDETLRCDGAHCSLPYDLARSPAPICFFVDGGAMLGPAIRSNVMSVSESAVRDAILEYQRGDAAHGVR